MTERVKPSGTPVTDEAKKDKLNKDENYPGGEKDSIVRDQHGKPVQKDQKGEKFKQPGDDPGSKA